ncbi:substrate-binding domain-containing protein [Granulicella sp. dw_53]|uniref:substrate-binding domain-containing protein n=1 Tax=Granulicella sp. dw_53 TaxID=2719792 RepID=UPI001BD67C36|nr:substrate-binding domain-containing protein [Granulicella sp. dw_53]
MHPSKPSRANLAGRTSFQNGEWILLLALLAEAALFSVLAPGFFTLANLFEILRFSVELGLLSIALTPIIIAGGIDLSVGSTVGLTAVIFGLAWHSGHLPIPLAILIALLIGLASGALNALMIAGLRLPALIVTLGTYSLYRGIAEGITHGAVSYTGFPKSFLLLGQGYLWHTIPIQLTIFLLVAIGYALLLHRSVIGRALYAIGFNPEGARYAGIPVQRRLALVYLLSGIVSSLAAIIYVAHLGLAKSDLGTGFELSAIAAVVLGGTSVFGGRGTLFGTLLGLFFLSILQNGMHLLALPSELTGVLIGTLLLAIVSIDRLRTKRNSITTSEEKRRPKTQKQIAAIAALLLVAALAFIALRSRNNSSTPKGTRPATTNHRPVIAVMPKAKGDPYFISARAGAEEAAQALGIDLIWDGPTSLDASQQNELVENWITRGVDAIVVAVENKGSISTVLRKARQHGISVLTWDADAEPDARDFFLNQATPEGIANTLTDEAARLMPAGGQFAIITGALSAENQNEWIAYIKKRVAAKHPQLILSTIQPSDDDRDKAFTQTQTILKVFPQVKLIMDISAPAVPGSAEAVQQSGRKDVDVIGLSLPNICKPYVKSGVVQTIVLWNTRDLGYLTVYAGWLSSQKQISKEATSIAAGRLGKLQMRGTEIILGTPLIINKDNIDHLDF